MSDRYEIKCTPGTQIGTSTTTVRVARVDVDPLELRDRIVRVLNQIRAQKLDMTVHKLKSMAINSEEKLNTLVKAIFEKSVNDPQNVEAYTKLCARLSALQVRSVKNECIWFRKLLERRCRHEIRMCFTVNESEISQQWRQKIEAIGFWHPAARSEAAMTDREKLYKIGSVVFLGHLFMAQMLTVDVMKAVISKLFSLEDEDSWNCLCSLLLFTGREMEARKLSLARCLKKMRDVLHKRHFSTTAAYNLELVTEYRRDKWGQVESVRDPCDTIQKPAPSRLREDDEEDDAWAVGTLSHIVVPRRVLRNQMRQAKDRFNET